MKQRRLTLKAEHLSELTTAELRDVAGGDGSLRTCAYTVCNLSDWALSLCSCLTHYCGSYDVC